MIKKTLYFGNPAYLSCKSNQLIIDIKNDQNEFTFFELSDNDKRYFKRNQLNSKIPIEDIGIIVKYQ